MKPMVFLVGAILSLNACRSARHSPTPTVDAERIPPNACKVVVTVVAIDSTRYGSGGDDPCSKAPCKARVRIVEVLGYGVAFPVVLASGDVVPVHFAFTTAPTREILPSLTKAFPGVTVGSTITTTLIGLQQIGSEKPSFTIYGYTLK